MVLSQSALSKCRLYKIVPWLRLLLRISAHQLCGKRIDGAAQFGFTCQGFTNRQNPLNTEFVVGEAGVYLSSEQLAQLAHAQFIPRFHAVYEDLKLLRVHARLGQHCHSAASKV